MIERRTTRAVGRFLAGDASSPYRRRAFTFIEIIIVIMVLGLIFALALPNLSPVIPKYRLRSAARQIGQEIENVRLAAITRGYTMGIQYDVDGDSSSYRLIPGPPTDYPDQPIDEREPLARKELPTGIAILDVRLRGSGISVHDGILDVLFSPTGTTGSHTVTFGVDERRVTLEFNAITGTVDYFEGEAGQTPEDFEG